jgi:ABC-2 type transport system permease protein
MDALKQIAEIAKRELRGIWTDPRLRSVVLLAPFLYAALFCLVYAKHTLTELPIAVVQGDTSAPARTLVRMLEMSPKLHIARTVYSAEELKSLIHDQSVDAAVIIPDDFARQLKRGRDVHVTAYVNAASMVSANTAAKAINEVVQTFSAGVEIKTLMKKGERLESAMERFMPVKLDLRSLFNPSFNYSNFMVPGLLIAILQQVILLGIALSWTGEKEKGTLPELFAISRTPFVLMLGKALPYFLINAVVAEFYLRVLFPLNDIPMEGSWLIAIPFTFLFVMTVVTWGMWVSGLCRTRLFATQALMFVAMPSFVLSGFTWPVSGMTWFPRFLGQLLPMTYFVTSFRNIYLANAPFEFIAGSVGALVGFLALNIVLALVVIRRLVHKTVGAEAAAPVASDSLLQPN